MHRPSYEQEDHAQRACFAALHLQGELVRYATEVKREHGVGVSTRMDIHSSITPFLRLVLADACRAAGDPVRAVAAHLGCAHAAFTRMGATGHARRTAAVLAKLAP